MINKKSIILIGVVLALLSFLYWLSANLNARQSLDVNDLMSLIANCGTYVKTSFSSDKKETIDYFIVLTSSAFVLSTFIYSIKYLVKPLEENNDHIKYQILEDEKDN